MNAITRAYEAESLDFKPGDRAVVAYVNTDGVDRYRTVISPAGIDLRNYDKTRTVLWEHGNDPTRGRVPIGRNLWIKYSKRDRALIARTEFFDDEYSSKIYRMYQEGYLTGFSVNVLPQDGGTSPPTAEERAARPELAACDLIYRRTELAEYSAVSVPGNADAIKVAVSRGLWVPEEVRAGVMKPGPNSRSEDDADTQEPDDDADDESLSRYIKKVGDRWDVFSEAGDKLGSHATEAEAKAQLAAIEAHKHERSAPAAVVGRPYSSIHDEILGEVRMTRADLLKHIRDCGELLRGRV